MCDNQIAKKRSKEIIKSLTELAEILNKSNIKYNVFKTIIKFPVIPSDIDILIKSEKDFKRLLKELKCYKRYELYKKWPYTYSVIDKKLNVRIDFYLEISLENIIYIDKYKCEKCVTKILLIPDVEIYTYEKSCEMLYIIGQSTLCEAMFDVHDIITTSNFLRSANDCEINKFVEITKLNHMTNAVKWYFISYIMLKLRKKKIKPYDLNALVILKKLDGSSNIPLHRYNRTNTIYVDIISLSSFFKEKMKDKKFKKSLAKQLLRIFTFRYRIRRYLYRGLMGLINES